MKTTAHPFSDDPFDDWTHKESYCILRYPSECLLSVNIGDGDILMDKDQAIELLRILQLAVPELMKGKI